jgi:hypothetical protein
MKADDRILSAARKAKDCPFQGSSRVPQPWQDLKEVAKNRTGQNRWKTDVETVQLVRELARILPDHSIAPLLNRLGIRSAKGQSWTQLRVV